MSEIIENFLAVCALSILIIIYTYLLLTPSNNSIPFQERYFTIPSDTSIDFQKLLEEYSSNFNYKYNSSLNGQDDFFLSENDIITQQVKYSYSNEPIIPSDRFICTSGWVSFRSEACYKYLWLYGDENMWMSATASSDTPLHLKSFEIIPVDPDCKTGGWVMIRALDPNQENLKNNVSKSNFICLNPPINGTNPDKSPIDEWVILVHNDRDPINDHTCHFLLEETGYLLNRGGMAFVNVLYDHKNIVRGHSGSWDRTRPAGREYGAMVSFHFIDSSNLEESYLTWNNDIKLSEEQDKAERSKITSLPTSHEKRVISFGLYGNNTKYTGGAIENSKLAKTYFPGWICRYYVTNDVPKSVIDTLVENGAEIEKIPEDMGYASGMFYRFLVAADNTVDRYIIRDVDSRLNARDRLAVEEWINSKQAIHIERDHVNHCIPMNGGMWGGVNGALPMIKEQIEQWTDKDRYAADLKFLQLVIWPDIQHRHIAHDSYCCNQFPSTKPFPTKRPPTYQHVGQVFNSNNQPRYYDIEGFIRGVPIPNNCRKNVDWIYG